MGSYTGISVRSMRRADILEGIQAWINSRITHNQMHVGRLQGAEIVAYKFNTQKDCDGDSRLYLALKTQLGDIEAACVTWWVSNYGELYAAIFSEDELDGWCYDFPAKILRVLTPATSEKAQAWRSNAIFDAAERAAIKAKMNTLSKIFKA